MLVLPGSAAPQHLVPRWRPGSAEDTSPGDPYGPMAGRRVRAAVRGPPRHIYAGDEQE